MLEDVKQFVANKGYKLPLYSYKVQAGFPTTAEDDLERIWDFNEYLIQHPSATFLVRVTGDSMADIGIFENDIVIVDKSINPSDGKIVIAAVDNQFTIKRLKYINKRLYLISENKKYPPIEIKSENDLHICGVVTGMVRKF